MSKFTGITNYYVQKAYKTAVWAFMDHFNLNGFECEFLGIKAQRVLTDCTKLLGWH